MPLIGQMKCLQARHSLAVFMQSSSMRSVAASAVGAGSGGASMSAAGPSSMGGASPGAGIGGPWSKEDLERMVEDEYREDEEALGGTWRMFFEDDPAELFEYTDRAYQDYEELMEEALSMSATDRRVSRGLKLMESSEGRHHVIPSPAVNHCPLS